MTSTDPASIVSVHELETGLHPQEEEQGEQDAIISLGMADGVSVLLPNTLEEPATYVLSEQDDWYEGEIRFLRNIIEPGMRILDMQAGYGCYALSMAGRTGIAGAVLALEADHGKRALLAESARINDFTWFTASAPDTGALTAFLKQGVDIVIAPESDDLLSDAGMEALTEPSPLIMVRAMGDNGPGEALLARMRGRGYAPYRLIPGLGILAPVAEGFQPSRWHRQLFFCRPDRAERLAAAGFLAQNELASVELPDDPAHWTTAFQRLPHLRKERLPSWEQQSQQEPVRQALSAYALAHDADKTPDQRYGYLTAAASLLMSSDGFQQSTPRLCTFARIAAELGYDHAAVNALQALMQAIGNGGGFATNEPFLPLSWSYDCISSGKLANWVLAQALQQMELLQFPTSYDSDSDLAALNASLRELGYEQAGMVRRCQLARMRGQSRPLSQDALRYTHPDIAPMFSRMDGAQNHERPLVSFVMLAYNNEKYIRESVKGALSQTYSPLEIIISDDCSTDATFEIIQQTVSQYTGPHKVILNRNEKNLKGRRNVHVAAALSSGELIVYADGDDISLDHRVEECFKLWQRYRPSAIYSNAILIDGLGQKIQDHNAIETEYTQDMANTSQPPFHYGAGAAYDRRVLDMCGPLPMNARNADTNLAWRALLANGIAYSPQQLLKYRFHGENASLWSKKARATSEREKILIECQNIENQLINLNNVLQYAVSLYGDGSSFARALHGLISAHESLLVSEKERAQNAEAIHGKTSP